MDIPVLVSREVTLEIVSYHRTVSNYFEGKSDIYSLLITVGLIYLDKKNL